MPVGGWACTGVPSSNAPGNLQQVSVLHPGIYPCRPSATLRTCNTILAAPAKQSICHGGSSPSAGQVQHLAAANARSVLYPDNPAHQTVAFKAFQQPRNKPLTTCSASPSPSGGAGSAFGDPNTLVGILMAYAVQLQQQQGASAAARGAEILVEGIGFHPPGSEKPLLQDINMALPANSLGLVMGRSGSGKTTLLQVLAGLTEQTSGHIRILRGGVAVVDSGNTTRLQQDSAATDGDGASSNGVSAAVASGGQAGGIATSNGANGTAAAVVRPGLTVEERMQQVGLVFQFPERHFLGEDLMQELTFTWPRLMQYWGERQQLSARMQQVLEAVGLQGIPLHVQPWALSGGQQRRLALAIQLVRQPALLLLDEPLAGLDWEARQEVVTILRKLKEQCTVLVVSHDLAEIAPLVNCAWRMRIGGTCEPVAWPPMDLAGLEQ